MLLVGGKLGGEVGEVVGELGEGEPSEGAAVTVPLDSAHPLATTYEQFESEGSVRLAASATAWSTR